MSLNAITIMLGLGAVAAAFLIGFAMRLSVRVTFVLWLVVLFFVPLWVGFNAGIFFSAITGLTLLAICVHGDRFRFAGVDGIVIGFVAVTTVLLMMGEVRLSPYVTAMLDWLLPYFWGRLVAENLTGSFMTRTVAGLGVALAGVALLEVATGTNVFVMIPGSGTLYATWSPLQERGGFIRAEGALGHSIALGAVLAMCSAFVTAARWQLWIKISGLSVIGVAVVFTFSRTGLVTLILTVGLSVLLLRQVGRRTRWVVGSTLMMGAVAALPFLADVFSSAGDEAEGSAGYRTDLLVLLSQVRPIGGAGDWEDMVVGDMYLGFFARSTDNAIVSILLRFGYLPTALLFAAFIAAIVISARRGLDPAGVALIAQIPSLFVVALITQYGMLLWFFVGVAASARRSTATGAEDHHDRALVASR